MAWTTTLALQQFTSTESKSVVRELSSDTAGTTKGSTALYEDKTQENAK